MNIQDDTNDNTIGICVLFAIALSLLCCLIVSYKKGKIINGYVRFGQPPFVDRKLDPRGYWAIFTIISLLCAFAAGFAIWVLIYAA